MYNPRDVKNLNKIRSLDDVKEMYDDNLWIKIPLCRDDVSLIVKICRELKNEMIANRNTPQFKKDMIGRFTHVCVQYCLNEYKKLHQI